MRKIEAFQINTRVLTASGNEIKLQLGRNMGIKKGDEYSVMVSETIEGFKNDTEKGLSDQGRRLRSLHRPGRLFHPYPRTSSSKRYPASASTPKYTSTR